MFSSTCDTDFLVIGFQPGEKWASVVRLTCTLVTVSIISSWCNRRVVGKYILFFSHWLSGLLHQLAQLILAQMVFLCWGRSALLPVIQAVKFVELTASNMLAVTNVAICVNLAIIVSSHHTMSRVQRLASTWLISSLLGLSVLETVTVLPFWETVTVSGTLFWSINLDETVHNWVMVSIFLMELVAGTAMATIFVLLAIFRAPELCEVWQLSRRIKLYFILTAIAVLVDLSIGLGGVVYVLHDRYKPPLIAATWTARHVHIALDTLVLYSALTDRASAEDEGSQTPTLRNDRGPGCPSKRIRGRTGTAPENIV